MAIARMFVNPRTTQEQYDAAVKQLGDSAEEGPMVHVAGPGPDGAWRVIEVWESEQAAHSFDAERVEPVLARIGVERPAPETWHVHRLLVRNG